jgi:broad-specificity NMP kinase
MGVRSYLIEGVSGTGKTSVCRELRRRGYQAINGDRELSCQGVPETGEPADGLRHEHHIWHVDKVKYLVADQGHAVTFFCGGSRNFSKFIDLFDGVFVLEVDLETLNRRLDERPDDEWGGKQPDRDLIVHLHHTTFRRAVVIDATRPLVSVVDDIICRIGR